MQFYARLIMHYEIIFSEPRPFAFSVVLVLINTNDIMNAITTFLKNFIVKTEKPYSDKCGNDVVII